MVTSYSELIMPKTIPCDGCQIAPTPINLQHTYVLHIKNQAQSYLTFLPEQYPNGQKRSGAQFL